MADQIELADLLTELIERAGVPDTKLPLIVNERVKRPLLSRRNLQNWKNGTSKKPRDWQPIIGIAIGLKLLRKDTNQLLRAAGQPSLVELQSIADEQDRSILLKWERVEQNRQKEILQEIAEDSVVQEKPPAIADFLGREAKVKQVISNLKPGKIVALFGAGGIGKSAIAIEVLHHLTPENHPPQEFPDGILFHNFYERPYASQVFQRIVERFAMHSYTSDTVPPATRDAAQRALEGKRVLLVLDGAENAKDLQSVVSTRGQCGVLMTTRVRVEADVSLPVEALSEPDAEKLLRTLAKNRADTEAAIAEICNLVGCLPLALRLIGRYLDENQLDASEYLPLLRDERLEMLDMDARQRESVLLVLKKSVAALSETGRLILAMSGLLGFAPFSNEVVAAGYDISVTELYAPLGELVRFSLFERPETRYRPIHILIYQYAQTYLDDLITPEHATRLMIYFTQLATEYSKRGKLGLTQLALEQAHILALLETGKNRTLWEPTINLAATIDEYLDLRGHWEERVAVNEIRHLAAQRLRNDEEISQALVRAGIAYFRLSQYQQAEKSYQEALTIVERLQLLEIRSWTELQLGNLFLFRSQIIPAQSWFQRCLETCQQTGNTFRRAMALNGLANLDMNKGEVHKAIEAFNESVRCFQKANVQGQEKEMAKALDNLAVCYRRQGNFKKALELHQRTLAIFQAAGEVHAEILTIMRLGNVYLDQKQPEKAVTYYENIRKLSREIKDRYALNMILINLGIVYSHQGRFDNAIEVLEEAKNNAEILDDAQRLGGALNSLGNLYREKNLFEKSIDYHQAAVEQFRRAGNAEDASKAVIGLADTYLAKMDYAQAIDHYTQALATLESISGQDRLKVIVLKGLGLVCQGQGQVQEAENYWEKAFSQTKPEWPEHQELFNLLKKIQ